MSPRLTGLSPRVRRRVRRIRRRAPQAGRRLPYSGVHVVRAQPNTPTEGNLPTRAEVRAAQRRRRSLILLGVIVALAVALAAVLGVIFWRMAAGETGQASAGECLPSGLRITADPAVAPALEAVVGDLTGTRTDCPEVTIRAEDSAITAAALAGGSSPDFDVWLPDSAMWPAQAVGQAELAGTPAADLVVSAPVASTPIVFAATPSTATALQTEGVGFASLAERSVAAVLPDPATE